MLRSIEKLKIPHTKVVTWEKVGLGYFTLRKM